MLSFSIYLVSLSLYTKLACKVLFKRHLIFLANKNPMFFLSIHSLETSLYLTLQQLGKLILSLSYCLGYYKIVELPRVSPLRSPPGLCPGPVGEIPAPPKSPATFYMPTTCGNAFGSSFSAPSLPNMLHWSYYQV